MAANPGLFIGEILTSQAAGVAARAGAVLPKLAERFAGRFQNSDSPVSRW